MGCACPVHEFGAWGPANSLLELWGVLRMGAPESAQNNKCGPVQTQYDFPHPLCEGEMFLQECQIFFPTSSLCVRGHVSWKCQSILEMIFQIIFEIVFVKLGMS